MYSDSVHCEENHNYYIVNNFHMKTACLKGRGSHCQEYAVKSGGINLFPSKHRQTPANKGRLRTHKIDVIYDLWTFCSFICMRVGLCECFMTW